MDAFFMCAGNPEQVDKNASRIFIKPVRVSEDSVL
jgi:hypothetical protein